MNLVPPMTATFIGTLDQGTVRQARPVRVRRNERGSGRDINAGVFGGTG